jgi:hypothetical protein
MSTKNNPITSQPLFFHAVYESVKANCEGLIAVGDAVKRTPLIRMYLFLGLLRDNPIDKPDRVSISGNQYTMEELHEFIDDYVKGIPLFVIPTNKAVASVKEFLYNYNDYTITYILERLHKTGLELQYGKLYDVKNNAHIDVEEVEAIFQYAGVGYFPPDAPMNI